MKKQILNISKFLFFLGLGILLVYLAVKDKTGGELNNIKLALGQANYFWIIISLIVSAFSHFFRALRWQLLLEPLHYKPGIFNTFCAVIIGYFANLALPRLGEITRCGVLARYEKIPFVQGFGSVIAERTFDVVSLILLFFTILCIEFEKISGIANELILNTIAKKLNTLIQKQLFVSIAFIIMALIIFGFFYFRKTIQTKTSGKIKKIVMELWDGVLSIKNIHKPILFITYTILIWLMYILQVYACFFAFEELTHLSFVVAMVVTIFGSLAVAVIPGGTGMYQLIVIQILTSVYVISSSTSFAFAWAVWASQIILTLIAGLIAFILLPLVNKNTKQKLVVIKNLP